LVHEVYSNTNIKILQFWCVTVDFTKTHALFIIFHGSKDITKILIIERIEL